METNNTNGIENLGEQLANVQRAMTSGGCRRLGLAVREGERVLIRATLETLRPLDGGRYGALLVDISNAETRSPFPRVGHLWVPDAGAFADAQIWPGYLIELEAEVFRYPKGHVSEGQRFEYGIREPSKIRILG